METGSIYDITIEPVNMSGHYALMFIVCGIFLIGGIICYAVSYKYLLYEHSLGERIGMILAGVGVSGLLAWGLVGLSIATDSTVSDRVG